MSCSKCKKDVLITNKFFNLCNLCNNIRLALKKTGKKDETNIVHAIDKNPIRAKKIVEKKQKNKSLFSQNFEKSKKVDMFLLDNLFYEQCFNLSNHKCEECNNPLPDQFKDDNGKIIARFRYSHIIPKSIAPNLRHDTENINHLCLTCHARWENKDKINMNIFQSNLLKFPQYLNRLIIN